MTEKKDFLSEELAHTGEPSIITPELMQLDSFRIMSDTDVPEEEFLFRLFGKPCFPRRDLTAVTGLEKCGKTFFTSMLMACCAQKQVLALERINEEPLKLMWFDTEQSKQSTKEILTDRVAKMIGGDYPEGQFFVFNVRSCNYEERLNMLVIGIETYHPDLVIIDNISDLLPSINDGEASVRIIDQLMQLATEYDCNIIVVIHLNKSGEKRNLRGWLGTEILHKAFEVYYCEQIYGTDIFCVEQTLTRKYRISDKIFYKITDDGLPVPTDEPNIQPRDAQGKFMSNKQEAYQISADKAATFNQDYIIRHPDDARHPWEWNLQKLFSDAMAARASLGNDDMRKAVMKLAAIRAEKYYDKVFAMAEQQQIVKQSLDRNGRVVVIVP